MVAGGATSASGIPEFHFNLAMARQLRDALLETGEVDARVLDETGAPRAPRARAEAAEALGATVLLSIHHDSVQPQFLETTAGDGRALSFSDRFEGYSLFVSRAPAAHPAGHELAHHLGQALRAAGFVPTLHHAEDIEGERKPLLDSHLGVYAYDSLGVLRATAIPAVLVECGVIVHRQEEQRLLDAGYRRRMATTLAQGVLAHLRAASRIAERGIGK
ncbi:MAG: N-acetylmuramoyl-L-alanine amidase [Vicinamibacteria bacterium]|nr:N-acetylmuramoyl-L-alanine amidase [Vicinamibacteria bacterium]